MSLKLIRSPAEGQLEREWFLAKYRGETWGQAFSLPVASITQQACLLRSIARGEETGYAERKIKICVMYDSSSPNSWQLLIKSSANGPGEEAVPCTDLSSGASVNPREHQPQQDPGQKECLPRLAVPVRREQLSAGSPQGSETRLGVSRDARS